MSDADLWAIVLTLWGLAFVYLIAGVIAAAARKG